MVIAHLPLSEEQIAAFCRKWHISELAFFGSVLRDDFGPESDVDVLFTLKPGHVCDWDNFWGMKEELESLTGRSVDFIEKKLIEESPNWIRRRAILSTAETVYAAG